MHKESEEDNQLRDFILFYPVFNLKISKDIGGEIKIERVHFISREKIPRIRKRIGLKQKVSELSNFWEKKFKLPKLFGEAPSFAFIKFKSRPKAEIIEPISKIKDSFWILASSQFFRTNRYNIEYFGLPEHQENIKTGYVLYDSEQIGTKRAFKRLSPIMPYTLDKNWKMYLKNHFFFYLLNILNGKTEVDINSNWKKTIRNAAILAGKSNFSKDLSQTFLYNMIAIDSLLQLDPSERYPDLIINRYFVLFGWLTDEDPKFWKSKLERLYKLRCKMVHNGDISDIKTEDLIESDNVLFNLLYNICRFIKVFPNKQSLTNLSKKIEARRILGQKIIERPNLRYFHHGLTRPTISRIKKENNWP